MFFGYMSTFESRRKDRIFSVIQAVAGFVALACVSDRGSCLVSTPLNDSRHASAGKDDTHGRLDPGSLVHTLTSDLTLAFHAKKQFNSLDSHQNIFNDKEDTFIFKWEEFSNHLCFFSSEEEKISAKCQILRFQIMSTI